MADSEVVSLVQAQLKIAGNTVREMARRLGVDYVLWDPVKAIMAAAQIDRVEVAEFLATCIVVEMWNMFGLARYRVVPEDIVGARILSATVSVHAEIITIEVVSLKTTEV